MVHRCKEGIRYRRWDVGRPKHHYLQVAYCGDRLVESKLKKYKSRKKR
jgi:hypothetical protein